MHFVAYFAYFFNVLLVEGNRINASICQRYKTRADRLVTPFVIRLRSNDGIEKADHESRSRKNTCNKETLGIAPAGPFKNECFALTLCSLSER